MREWELAEMLEGTSDAAFAVDLQGEIRTWNKAAEKLFGFDASAVLGKQCSTLFAGRTASELPICRHECQILTCARKGKGLPNFDMQVNTNTGRQKWINVSILLVTNAHTERRLTVHLVRDIGKRKKTEDLSNQLLQMARNLVSSADDAENAPPAISLTEQEKKILTLIAAGKTTKDIVGELNITVSTLRNHISHVNQKLNTNNRIGAAMQAIKNGLI
jgi:PAS domain S-box-containing protein